MKRYDNILSRINETPWMMTPESLEMMLKIIHARTSDISITSEDIRVAMGAQGPRALNGPERRKAVAVLPLYGPIFPKANMMTEMSGATSLAEFQQEFRSLMADPNVDSIVLDVDSPGGSAMGIQEMAQEIFDARESKPIYSVTSGLGASAAFYLASQAHQMFASPSSLVGSIGVIMTHEDTSKQEEMEGIKKTFIYAGPYKSEGYEPLTDAATSHLQGIVNEMYGQFIADVGRARNVSSEFVESNFGGGRVVTARNASTVGMIDGIATLDDVLGQLIQPAHSHDTGSNRVAAFFPIVPSLSSDAPDLGASYDADKEHSEPGTGQGGEPTPRTPPEDGDKGIKNGWRRQSPPAAYPQEGSVMNRESLEALATRLGVEFTADTDDATLSAAVVTAFEEFAGPLLSAQASADAGRSFRQDYPEEWQRMQSLLERDRINDAKAFADKHAKFNDGKHGFSAAALTIIEETHMKIAAKVFEASDFEKVIEAITSDGIVDYSERGSARTEERSTPRIEGKSVREIREEFAGLVKQRMEQDGLDLRAARNLVAEEHPDLAQAYLGR